MDNQNQQPNTGQVSSQASSLDPQAVMLAQSIRDVESGGDFQAKGASGEYGAYQWTPDSWNEMSKSAGVNVPLESSTSQQQNEVAYKTIESWKNQGMNVGQIASKWNSNNPNAYQENDTGVNKEGVSYNVPQYAEKVAETYQNLKSDSQDPPTPSPQGEPKNQAITTGNNSMPTWEKWALGLGGAAAGALGVAGLTALTGGADIPIAAGLAGAEGAADLAGAGAGVGEAAGEAATGAGEAAGSSSGGLLSKVLNVAKNTLIGEGMGQAIGQAKGLLGSSQSPVQSAASPQVSYDDPSVALKGTTVPQAVGASQTINNALTDALQQTPTGRAYSQTPDAQSGLQGLSEYGIVPEVVNGSYTTPEAEDRVEEIVGGLSDNVGQALEAEGQNANIDDAVGSAVENMKKYTPSNEWAEATQHIQNEAETYKQFADEDGNISLGTMERMKKEQGRAGGKWDSALTSPKRAAHKALNRGAREVILKNTKNKDLYEKAMKEEQKLINGKKVLKRLNGKKAHHKDSLTRDVVHHLSQYAAIAVGDRIGGPFGAIVGSLLGSRFEKMVSKKFGQNVLDMKSTRKALEIIGKKDPEVSNMLQSIIKKYKMESEHKKVMDTKRKEYQKNKEGILNPKKESEYEPYDKEIPTIKGGRKLKKKEEKGLYSKIPVIKA